MAGKKAAPGSSRESEADKAPDDPRESVIPDTGEYSRLMKADEYREWVRQTVSGQIWGRMTAIFSAIGFATIVAMFTYISNVSNSAIEGKIATETKKLNEEVEKRLPNVVNLELSNQIRTNRLIPQISESAVKQITESKGVETALQNLIITQSQKLLQGRDPSQSSLRAVALQQILLFGDEHQKVEAITNIILDEKSGEQEFSLALQNYPSHQSKSNVDQRRSLHNVLERGALRGTNFSDDSWRAVEQILKQEADILEACGWIRNAAMPMNPKYSINSLHNMVRRIAKIGGQPAGEQFIAWLESNDLGLRELGQNGLTSSSPPEDSTKRQALALHLTRALANTKLPRDSFAEHLAALASAIRQKDKASLRRIAESEFASQRIKTLVGQLVLEPDNRERWSFASRSLTTPEGVQNYGRYGQYERNLPAYRLLGTLLDTSGNSTDWDKVVEPKIEEAAGKWTSPGQANLLVNAWVTVLQKSASPNPASLSLAAELFIEAHAKTDRDLFLNNSQSYRYLMNRADDAVFKKFIDKASIMIGAADQSVEEIKESEATILAEALTRFLREEPSAERIKQIRNTFSPDVNKRTAERISAIWFSAVRQQYAEIDSKDEVLSVLSEKIKKGYLESRPATVLLSIITNRSFLQLDTVRSAAEQANLHLFSDDIGRLKSDAVVSDLAQAITNDAKNAFGWVDKLPELSIPFGSDVIPLNAGTTWLSIDVPPSQVAEFSLKPPAEARYTFVGSSNRVSSGKILHAPTKRSDPIRFITRTDEPGRQFLRIDLLSPAHEPKIVVNYLPSRRAADLTSAKKGGVAEIWTNGSVAIETKGNDEAWFRLNAKANTAYVLRTRALQSEVDTVIEVYDRTETQKLQEDDDGGGDDPGGEEMSSRLSLFSASDIVYHIRIKNIEAVAGSFVFEVTEEPRSPN